MLDCPNELTCTFTTDYPPIKDQVLIHLTINQQQISEEFLEEISGFLEAWPNGLEQRYFLIKNN
jgi:hypothetical protein